MMTADELIEHLIGPPVAGRGCGDCVACCAILAIDEPELRKDAGVLCPHNSGCGCTIYAERPAMCRTWYCVWRRLAPMPAELRPDLCGLMFYLRIDPGNADPFQRVCLIGCVLPGWESLPRDSLLEIAAGLMHGVGMPVWLNRGDETEIVYPDARLRDAIADPDGTRFRDLVPQALAWRAMLPGRLDAPA